MAAPRGMANDGTVSSNPRKAEVDREWPAIQGALHQRLGSRAVELMDALWRRDRGLWCSCASRIESWFVSYVYSKTTNRPDDQEEAWDAARSLWADFLWNLYNREIPVHVLQVADVPYVLQNLPESFTLLPDIRPVNPSAIVDRATRKD